MPEMFDSSGAHQIEVVKMTDQELFKNLATFSIVKQKQMRDKAFAAHEAERKDTSDQRWLDHIKKTLIEIVEDEVRKREATQAH
jgi:elongation factor P--beta-lysine ligase